MQNELLATKVTVDIEVLEDSIIIYKAPKRLPPRFFYMDPNRPFAVEIVVDKTKAQEVK